MSTIALFDTLIGLVFIYAVYSLTCSAIVEWASTMLLLRQRLLMSSIADLLGDTSTINSFHAHQLIAGLKRERWFRSGKSAPDYIPNEIFALVFMNLTMRFTPGAPGAPRQVTVNPHLPAQTAQAVNSLMQGTNNVGPVQARVERWFADAMETASGRYKRWTQLLMIPAALFVTVIFNLNTTAIMQQLYASAPLRTNLVSLAEQHVREDVGKLTVGNIHPLDLPIGFQPPGGRDGATRAVAPRPPIDAVIWAAGHVLSIVALSFGAAFWFDLLKRLVNLRQTQTPPDEKRPGTT